MKELKFLARCQFNSCQCFDTDDWQTTCCPREIKIDTDTKDSSIIVAGIRFVANAEATSWSVTESDLTGQGVDEDEDDVNLAPDGGSYQKICCCLFYNKNIEK